MEHAISARPLTLGEIGEVMRPGRKIVLGQDAVNRIRRCRQFLDHKLDGTTTYYGINTGFGALYDKSVSEKDLGQLQVNLMMSHACGTGEEVPEEMVRLMLLLKVQGLSYGNSGVQVDTVQLLADFFNNGIYPLVYEQGSLGASGDLAPLAHLCLPLIGKGEVRVKGERMPASRALEQFGLKPVTLQSKEGLALLNGTQFMNAYGTWCLLQAQHLEAMADVIGALSLEGFDGRPEPFHPLIQEIRPHAGQIATARRMRALLEGSELISRPKKHVQDPYAFRCIPQVHGASKDAINFAAQTILTELNAVTDNPTVFPEEDLILSAGNFHGQPLALALDFMAIALAELGNISERRTYQLISGARGLPVFLVANPGLDSGFMIPQYTAASIVSQNKQLCTPASVDSIVSSNGQEDHVSMGANAATKLRRVVLNLERILAIELFTAAQAMEFRRPAKTSPPLTALLADYRQVVPFVDKDRILYPDIQHSIEFVRSCQPKNIIL